MEPYLAVVDRLRSSRASAIRAIAMMVAVALGLVAVGVFTATLGPLPIFLGSIAGVLLFTSGYILVAEVWRTRLSVVRSSTPVSRRRWLALWIVLAWVLLLALFGQYAGPTVVLGAMNVAVLLGVWRLGSRTPSERIMDELEYESMADPDPLQWIADDEVEQGLDADERD